MTVSGVAPPAVHAPAENERQLLRRDVARLGKALDPLFDVYQRLQTGLDRLGRNIPQYIGCDGIAKTVEIVDKLTALRREKQPVGAPVLRIVSPFEETVLAGAAYLLIVATTFRLFKRDPILYVVGFHFAIWLVVRVGMDLSALVASKGA